MNGFTVILTSKFTSYHCAVKNFYGLLEYFTTFLFFRVLFQGKNDFMICLQESFPQLKSTNMTRMEWCQIRRLMGKPRRCSQVVSYSKFYLYFFLTFKLTICGYSFQAFFNEERAELERRRTKIRQLQQRKLSDLSSCKDLPDRVPLQLTVGRKVTARLRKPQDGLFTGTVDAVDTSNNTYRITFERPGLGTHSVPDYEVLVIIYYIRHLILS